MSLFGDDGEDKREKLREAGVSLSTNSKFLMNTASNWENNSAEIAGNFVDAAGSIINTAQTLEEGVEVTQDTIRSSPTEEKRQDILEEVQGRISEEVDYLDSEYEDLREVGRDAYEGFATKLSNLAEDVGTSLDLPEVDNWYQEETVMDAFDDTWSAFSERKIELGKLKRKSKRNEEQYHTKAERFLDKEHDEADEFDDLYSELAEEWADLAQGERKKASIDNLIEKAERGKKLARNYSSFMRDIYSAVDYTREMVDEAQNIEEILGDFAGYEEI